MQCGFPSPAEDHQQERLDVSTLLDLASVDDTHAQARLFDSPAQDKESDRLMATVDELNKRFGRSTVAPASTFGDDEAPWHMRQERMTPAYTTDWNQVVDIWR
ncbi:hypothetical protein AAV32_09835 [Kerstersia gyiorum]|uniref:DUF4113 domain-containing protein n=1 Tax=Kerstersia gyiorum TaxID=206506 RepID=A0A171KSJ1_9BURK|nr:hypothetical protein AAV32_09835 [Kerstersia gyiorum]